MSNQSRDQNHEYHTLRDSIGAGKKELTLVFILLAVYFYMRFINIQPLLIVILGLLGGTWLAFRPSEWAVEGIESASGHRGYTTYVAGMLSSLVSNMPEAVISGLSAWDGQQDPVFLDIAILSVLVAAGFNMLLLGLTIVLLTHDKGKLDVPEEAIEKDSDLIRWTVVALASMFALGIVDIASDPGGAYQFPREASFLLFLSYIIYAVALMRGGVTDTAEIAKPYHSKRHAGILMAIGLVGIFFAGEILTESVKILLEQYKEAIVHSYNLNPITLAALILGAAGSLPEHGIALVAASKGKANIAVGNLVGGVLQIVLLVAGGIGVFAPIPLDRYVLFQIVVIAGSLWFLKRAIADDHRLDTFEGMMIILLQTYVFVLLITGTPLV